MKTPRKLGRVNAYAKRAMGGQGLVVDVEGMFFDLVTVMKAGGCPKEEYLTMATEMWEAVEVEVAIPPSVKN